jgi:hypothetical protein
LSILRPSLPECRLLDEPVLIPPPIPREKPAAYPIPRPVAALKAPLIPVRRWMKKENPTDGIDFAKRLESARMTFR